MENNVAPCRVCGQMISEYAPRCPACGDQTAARFGHAKPEVRSDAQRWMIVALVLGIIVIIGYSNREQAVSQSEPASKPPSELTMRLGACEAAKEAVLERLQAPATAEFPGCAFEANEYEIRSNPEHSKFSVNGYVDAQNQFGAQLRRKFVVMLDRTGTDALPSSFDATEVAIE